VQHAYNQAHGITPQTIKKKIADIVGDIERTRSRAVKELVQIDVATLDDKEIKKLVKQKREEMHEAADALDFETAALIRDEIHELEKEFLKTGRVGSSKKQTTSRRSKK
jgi:excinuclease ABC subunit B